MRVSDSLSLELKLASRDTGAILTAGVLAIALTLSVLSGVRADQGETTALRTAAERVHEEWVSQPPKNPHTAAHYGILVYRPRAPLQAIEPGVLPYQGAVAFLEAHQRNPATLSPASVRAAESRFGGTRYSPMLQIAGGFLAMVLGFIVGSRESRRRMTGLLIGTGARGGPTVAAKAMVTMALVILAAAPSLTTAALQLEGLDAIARYMMLAGASLLHLFVLSGIGVATGLWLGSSRFGLTAVAFAWGMGVLIFPRMADVVAEQAFPLTQAELSAVIASDFKQGPDGHAETKANEVFERTILREYGVETREELPLNFDALLMQADEVYRGGVYDRRLTEAAAVREAQDRFRRIAWIFSPTPVMLDLSAQIASADAGSQRNFEESAEAFRRDLVGRLNQHMAVNSKSGDWAWTPVDGYFASFKAFQPPAATLVDGLPKLIPGGLALLIWCLATLLLLVLSGRRFDARAELL